ncbi:MAG: hypothetical protein HY900_24615, partial [Deltaproteobacteria bacterium]|nr:hypothetical protein [Deltaproteobacteria bacterium]
ARDLLPTLLGREPDPSRRGEWFHDEVHLEPAGHEAYGAVIGSVLATALSGR